MGEAGGLESQQDKADAMPTNKFARFQRIFVFTRL